MTRAALFLLLSVSLTALAASPVRIWVRGKGDFSKESIPRVKERVVDLEELSPVEVEQEDVQYGKKQKFRGVKLQGLVERFADDEVDSALLHFDNGMVVPVPLRDPEVFRRLDPLIALAIDEKGTWSTKLPEVARPGARVLGKPIRFEGNKVVVSSAWHPDVAVRVAPGFSPWRYVDRLWGIELLKKDAYAKQFEVGKSDEAKRGRDVFLGACLYCHGARGVGGLYGWDFVDPVPMHEYRSVNGLFLHVRYRSTRAMERGEEMPGFSGYSAKDAADVFEWLKAVAHESMPAYE